MLISKFTYRVMASIVGASIAASLLMSASALDTQYKTTPAGKLATACGVMYDKTTFKELTSAFNQQASALEVLGMGATKNEVCKAVSAVVLAKNDKKVDSLEYGNTLYYARAMLGASVLYQSTLSNAALNKATLQAMGKSFDIEGAQLARWTPTGISNKEIRNAAIGFVAGELASGGRSDIDVTVIKDTALASYIRDLNISP